jgi:hypothetical protein
MNRLVLILACISQQIFALTNYDSMKDKFEKLQKKYSSFANTFVIGKNDDGQEIIALRISTTPTKMDSKKIGQLIVASHHGNEQKTPDLALQISEELLKKYSSSELYKNHLSDTEWTVIPVLNIPGYNSNKREEKGLDPNRDYPGPCKSDKKTYLKSIQTMINFLETRTFAGTVTIHGYMGALTYPWGINVSNTHSLDHNEFDRITKKAASINGYRYGTSTDIVYPCDGSFEDYTYYKHGSWSLLIELQSGNSRDIEDSTQALLAYFFELNSSPSVKNQLTSSCLATHDRATS